jgi:hypothetical protein
VELANCHWSVLVDLGSRSKGAWWDGGQPKAGPCPCNDSAATRGRRARRRRALRWNVRLYCSGPWRAAGVEEMRCCVDARKPARSVWPFHAATVASSHPTGVLACATAPSLKPTPTTTWAASPQHQPKVSPVPPYTVQSVCLPVARLSHPTASEKYRTSTSAIRPPAQTHCDTLPDHSTNRPRHRPITVRPATGRPNERLSRSPASKQLRNRCAASPATETATRAWLCSVLRSLRHPPHAVPCALADAFPAPEHPHHALRALDAPLESPSAPVAGKS